jgi:hypothetical protein
MSTLHQLEAEHIAIEAPRTLDVGNLEVHMPDSDVWLDRHVTPRTPQSARVAGYALS